MKEKKRTDVDFSKHVLNISKNDLVTIYDFAIPGTYSRSIKFINTCGIMTVTGDYGNWVFCREFHPDKDGVSDGYWVEKLRILSCQDPYEFDTDTAREQIQELLGFRGMYLSVEEKARLEALKIKTPGDVLIALNKYELKDLSLTDEDIELLEDLRSNGNSLSDEERSWLSRLYDAAGQGEYPYIAEAMNRPWSFETECIPKGKIFHSWLPIIFDAFDEICRRVAL